jgi:hypothetical protein
MVDQEADYEEGKAYLSRLFKSLAPQCEPLSDLRGLVTQIDNYIAGMNTSPAVPNVGDIQYACGCQAFGTHPLPEYCPEHPLVEGELCQLCTMRHAKEGPCFASRFSETE